MSCVFLMSQSLMSPHHELWTRLVRCKCSLMHFLAIELPDFNPIQAIADILHSARLDLKQGLARFEFKIFSLHSSNHQQIPGQQLCSDQDW